MYSPKISEDLIPKLYEMARERKIPMTRLVSELLGQAIRIEEYKIETRRKRYEKPQSPTGNFME